jgi:hypothetical protein
MYNMSSKMFLNINPLKNLSCFQIQTQNITILNLIQALIKPWLTPKIPFVFLINSAILYQKNYENLRK